MQPQRVGRVLQRNILLVTICVGVLAGCKKEEASSPAGNPSATAPNAKPAQSGTPAAGAGQPAPNYITAQAQNEPGQNVVGEVHPFLTQQLQIFVQQKGRMPQSFAELAGARLDSIPSAPAGKKWVIDTASVQVKAATSQ